MFKICSTFIIYHLTNNITLNTNIELTNGTLTAAINPLGAELTSLKDNIREYMWDGDPKYWAKHSPVLFPIVGSLRNNTYLYEGKVYALNRHGFARDNIFNLTNQTEDSATFLLTANNDTKIMYPFDFELELKYILRDKTLHLEYTLRNTSEKKMPFALGAHPAFALPEKFSNYSLKFENPEELASRQLENNLISEKTITHETENGTLPLDYKLFENDALVFTGLRSRSVDLIEGEEPLLKVRYEKFPHLGIWTKDKAPFICIEPWQGHADTVDCSGNITEKEGMLILASGEDYKAAISIQVLR